jgi:hypothetical protein
MQDGFAVAERGQRLPGESGSWRDRPRAGAAELLVVLAEGADGERGRFAAAAIGLDVAAGRVWVDSDAHRSMLRR